MRWLLRHDARGLLRFAPLQGVTVDALRATHPGIPRDLASVVYLRAGRVHLRSKAFLTLAWHLRWPWRALYGLRWIPAFLGDIPYRIVASRRHRIVRTRDDACTLPREGPAEAEGLEAGLPASLPREGPA